MMQHAEALSEVLANSVTLPSRVMTLSKSLGHYLAEPLVAPFSLPRFDNSAVDGYGFRADDFREVTTKEPVTLHPFESIRAGEHSEQCLPVNGVVKVLTGAPIPPGVDSVIMREELEVGGKVSLNRTPIVGENIRHAGREVLKGTELLPVGTKITPSVIGMLATFGMSRVNVIRKPRISLFSSGDELVVVGKTLDRPSQIYDSNLPMVTAELSQLGIAPRTTYRLPDNLSATLQSLRLAMKHSDIVVTCGGISMGEYDFIRTAALELGIAEKFWKVAIKPGKPLFFGTHGTKSRPKLFFGLPGNPVAVMVTLEQFVLPAIRKLMGSTAAVLPMQSGILMQPITKKAGRLDFVRVVAVWADDHYEITPMSAQESHMLSGIAVANALLHFPEACEVLPAGATASFQWLSSRHGG
ncbi:MAG: molybdopterin molybdotransferase MoeA [bacterium]|nr:molybdopterin molybdotransferase MoeA [bacterium]